MGSQRMLIADGWFTLLATLGKDIVIKRVGWINEHQIHALSAQTGTQHIKMIFDAIHLYSVSDYSIILNE